MLRQSKKVFLKICFTAELKFCRWLQKVTTRAVHHVCDDYRHQSSSTSSSSGVAGPMKRNCEMETGYYLNPRDSCQTYSVFGRLPPLDAFQRSVVCVRPSRLTDMFDVSRQLDDSASIFVDKTIKFVRLSRPSRITSTKLPFLHFVISLSNHCKLQCHLCAISPLLKFFFFVFVDYPRAYTQLSQWVHLMSFFCIQTKANRATASFVSGV